MSMAPRVYIVDSGQVAISATGLSAPLLYLTPSATATANVIKVKVSCEAGAGAPTPPSNSSLFFSLNTVTGTKAGGSAVTPNPILADTLASNTTASSGAVAITGLTQTTERWAGTCPFSPGSFAGDDDPNTGEEVWLGASSQTAFFVTVPAGPGFGTNMFARVVCWIAE